MPPYWGGFLRRTPVSQLPSLPEPVEHSMHALHLTRGELSHTLVGAVVHVVVNIIQPRHSRAAILCLRTKGARCALRRRIGDAVAVARARLIARALKHVQQTEPMSGLVSSIVYQCMASEESLLNLRNFALVCVRVGGVDQQVRVHMAPVVPEGRSQDAL